MARVNQLLCVLFAIVALVNTVIAHNDPQRLFEKARARGYSTNLKKHSDEKKKREALAPSVNYMKRQTPSATSSVCTPISAPTSTDPPSCGGDNCANAFNKQFTASLDSLTAFCSSWTSGTSSSFTAAETDSWAANCVGTSTAAAQATAVAAKVSSLCDCYLPEPTPCPSNGFRFLTSETEPFRVVSLPEINFDIGEMYSGNIPIDTEDPSRSLFFVFQPTVGEPVDEITIWLNGGPGCSSLEGFFQENGLFIWAWDMYDPYVNLYSWVNLTNVLWVEQPVGTGFSVGNVTAQGEDDIAEEFAGFFLNFQKTFGISKFKIYVTGESYAGRYVPYISANFLDQNNTDHFDLAGALMYDPCIGSYNLIQEQMPAYPFILENNNIIKLNDSYLATLEGIHESCGYKDYIEKYLTFPAAGIQPDAYLDPALYDLGCRVNDMAEGAALKINPCFNSYEIVTQCPMPSDPLGYPTDLASSYPGLTPLYFDRADVKAAMHAPADIDWEECSGPVFVDRDLSPDSIQKVLPQVIEATNRVLVANADLDFVIITAGTLIAIQNMTWNGKLGFDTKPEKDIVITLPDLQYAQVFLDNGAGADYDSSQGVMGVQHFERGLMWAETFLSGHMQPQFQPRSSYRHLQWLLGYIEEL